WGVRGACGAVEKLTAVASLKASAPRKMSTPLRRAPLTILADDVGGRLGRLLVDAQAKTIAGMGAGLNAPAGRVAMRAAGTASEGETATDNRRSHLQWWGGALGVGIALADALILTWLGVTLTLHGHDVTWPVVGWFGLWFAVLGFM